jgi:hypothetical protein
MNEPNTIESYETSNDNELPYVKTSKQPKLVTNNKNYLEN